MVDLICLSDIQNSVAATLGRPCHHANIPRSGRTWLCANGICFANKCDISRDAAVECAPLTTEVGIGIAYSSNVLACVARALAQGRC